MGVLDKTAKLLGLGFPGGPAVERAAKGGDPQRFALPRPMWRKPGCDFSFSGLKTAVRQTVEKLDAADSRAIADLCASFQRTVGDVLVDRCGNALAMSPLLILVVAGGVAANLYLRGRLEALAANMALVWSPPIKLCTDNGATVAWAGTFTCDWPHRRVDFKPRPRWPLDPAASVRV
jgi:N6-L-threonylcarbamoyladenine synthase